MGRSVLSVIAGFVVWTVLWLGSNAGMAAVFPQYFRADGVIENVPILVAFLVLSVVFSIGAGYITGMVARKDEIKHALSLGVLQLAIGILVQSQYWDQMPLWYHLIFLALLLPGNVLGGKIRRDCPFNPANA